MSHELAGVLGTVLGIAVCVLAVLLSDLSDPPWGLP